MAPPSHSRALSRSPIFPCPNNLCTATILESGQDHGHQASLAKFGALKPRTVFMRLKQKNWAIAMEYKSTAPSIGTS